MVRVSGATEKLRTHSVVRSPGPEPSSPSSTGRRYGLRSSASAFGYSKPICSAQSSMKKSNGLTTFMSAISPTVIVRLRARFGKTSRATKLPNASCCQLMKWSAGSTCSE